MKSASRAALTLAFIAHGTGVALGQAPLGLHVVDSNGQRVGYVLDISDAAVSINGQIYAIATGIAGFTATEFAVYSTADDCSNPLVPKYEGGGAVTFFSHAWYTSDGMLHYPSPGSPGEFEAVASTRTVNANGTIGACTATGGFLILAPVASSAAPAFTPPFSVTDVLDVTPAPPTASFNDVPTSHPYFQFIEALKASGITGGCQASPPLYCPDNPVTRGQMAVFLAKALGL